MTIESTHTYDPRTHGENHGLTNGATRRLSLGFEKVVDEGFLCFPRLLALVALVAVRMQRRPQVVVHRSPAAGGIVGSRAYDSSSLYECTLADGLQVLSVVVLVTRTKGQI